MAPRDNAHIQGALHYSQIFLNDLSSGLSKLIEDVVIGDRGQDPRLRKAHVLQKLEVIGVGSDPAGDLRISISPVLTEPYCLFVLSAVQEEFTLPDNPLGPSQFMKEIVQVQNLCAGIRRA